MALPEGVTHWDGPGLDAWKPWAPEEAARALGGFALPWCVVGGWAVDLSLGEQTRAHEDLEIAIVRADFPAMREHLEATGLALHEVGDGEVRLLAPSGVTAPDKHQNWALDPIANEWRVDVMLEPGDADTWIFRRDERLRAPRAQMIGRSQSGVPHLKLHGALLYKAKAARPKDEADFARAAPTLDQAARAWLIEALTLVHPGHAWIAALGG